ncbi:MAG: ferrochelatase [Lysobacterales bacterium]|jgi:ferrochelatase
MNTKKAVLLVNLGTPDSPNTKEVRTYLREFLMDRRVIDIPWFRRFFLINAIIAPFRAPESAKIYKELWEKRGSPLKFYGEDATKALQERLGTSYEVFFAMRYKNPNVKVVLKEIQKKAFSEVIVIPMYPQYASSSTGSTIEYVMDNIKSWEVLPKITFLSQFCNDPKYIDAFVEQAKPFLKTSYDHYVFSYHGLPERQIHKASFDGNCQTNGKCCSAYHAKNQHCYRAQCFETTRNLAFSPAFVADCLETTIEVGQEYKEIFIENGGVQWDLVPSLNASQKWVDCLENLVKNH